LTVEDDADCNKNGQGNMEYCIYKTYQSVWNG